MRSVWSAETELENRNGKLPVKTQVLIIGGGITGILCAYQLQKAGVDCVVAEADRMCSGTTKNTTAKITSQHGLIYDSLIRRFGIEKAGLYFEANEAAIEQYRSMCRNIDCDFETKSAFVYSLGSREKLEKELRALEKIGAKARFKERLPLPFSVSGAIEFKNQAQFDPIKFISAIAEELTILENTRVIEINGHIATTNKGHISADKIIVATHFPFINKHGSYFLKLYQNRSYVMALENAPNYDGMYVDEAEKGLSFRNHKNMLLLGGGSHRTGKKGGGWDELSVFAKKHYPNAVERYRWAAQDCMSLDSVPYIGLYSKNTPNLFVASGFNKWGMTGAMTASFILRDMIMGRKNKYAKVFSPSRSILRPQLFVNAFESAVNILTPTVPRCPHLGCALKWNKQEHSWDCPCHGSRFEESGKLIDNPATGDLKRRG